MSGKTLWSIIFALVVINCLTVGYFLTNNQRIKASSENESIATIGDTHITREQWMAELEEKYGEETLKELINIKVVEQLAEKYHISVSDEDVERELAVYKSMYNSFDEEQNGNEEDWREQIRYSILLEELLTKDVTVTEEEIKNFYENNKELYAIDESYHLSQIIVNTKAEANKMVDELSGGSSFEALAIENSIDEFSDPSGGDIGFISKNNEYVPDDYINVAKTLKPGEWSEPIKVENGYAILLLHEKLEGKSYSYDEVRGQVRRQIALEQMQGSVSVEPLWDELNVKWFYGNNLEK
ncbi:peptidylprolyl isomerase [Bacillus sp. 7586-K]|nr:peptidylprolyl isomerase [Bacillus sp. 7586-K]